MTKERRILCPQCQRPVDFTVDFDTTRRTLLVSAVIPRNPSSAPPAGSTAYSSHPSPGSVPGASARRTSREILALCSCGTKFPVDDRQLENVQICPGCKCEYHVVVKTESAGKKRVAILVPRKPIVRRDEIIRATIYRKAAGSKAAGSPNSALNQPTLENPEGPASPGFVVLRKSRTRIVVPKTPPEPARPKPAPEVPPGAQAVPCPCGATFIVRKKDLAQGLSCSNCGLVAHFEETRDPQTLAPTIRIKASPDSKA